MPVELADMTLIGRVESVSEMTDTFTVDSGVQQMLAETIVTLDDADL